ncbi:hypothetical protein BGZ49_004482 [Haplosporangium sp. Z 27]|nr:hypothetical protein BGZ49_004482 [Haplosporangium sp. Z 27]
MADTLNKESFTNYPTEQQTWSIGWNDSSDEYDDLSTTDMELFDSIVDISRVASDDDDGFIFENVQSTIVSANSALDHYVLPYQQQEHQYLNWNVIAPNQVHIPNVELPPSTIITPAVPAKSRDLPTFAEYSRSLDPSFVASSCANCDVHFDNGLFQQPYSLLPQDGYQQQQQQLNDHFQGYSGFRKEEKEKVTGLNFQHLSPSTPRMPCSSMFPILQYSQASEQTTSFSHGFSPLHVPFNNTTRDSFIYNRDNFSGNVSVTSNDDGTTPTVNESDISGVCGTLFHPIATTTTSIATAAVGSSSSLVSPKITKIAIPKNREDYLIAISRAMSVCPWSVIATNSVPGRTGVQAQARWSEALDPQVKKGPWTSEEDALLLRGVQKSEKCWIWIADGIPGRTQRQCRTRWVQISSRQERLNAMTMMSRKGKVID